MKYEDMMPHQQRVVDEKVELDGKICKLDEFIEKSPIFWTLSFKEQKRLCRQYDVLYEYSEILGDRIEAFGEI